MGLTDDLEVDKVLATILDSAAPAVRNMVCMAKVPVLQVHSLGETALTTEFSTTLAGLWISRAGPGSIIGM